MSSFQLSQSLYSFCKGEQNKLGIEISHARLLQKQKQNILQDKQKVWHLDFRFLPDCEPPGNLLMRLLSPPPSPEIPVKYLRETSIVVRSRHC